MQLCRFALRESPHEGRSGIFHENRIYETDGEKAIGVHDLSKIVLLPPVQLATSLRVFQDDQYYTYRNSANFAGALAQFEVPEGVVAAEGRVVAILKDDGEQVDAEEAPSFILGYSLMLSLWMEDLADGERRNGRAPMLAYDLPFAIGPFLTIPEGEPGELFKGPLILKVNGNPIAEAQITEPNFPQMLAACSTRNWLKASDFIAAPPIPCPPITATSLGRGLAPGDTVQFGSDALGLLTIKLV